MSIQVRTFSDKKIKELIKAAPADLREYIAAQKRIIEGWEDINRIALDKIRELTGKLNENKRG